MPGRFSTTPLRVLAARHQVVGIVDGIPRRADLFYRWGLSARALNLWMWSQSYLAPYRKLRTGQDPGLVSWLAERKPDVLCVANFPHLLPPAVFERWPTLNLHPSLLPRWRGAYPWFWMYHAMDAEGGWTVHRIDAGEDTGPILAQESYPVPLGSTVTELGDRTLEQGGNLFADVLDHPREATPQPAQKLPRARRPRPGEKFVDWDEWPTRRVYHFLRGVCPLWVRELDLGPLFEPEFTGFDEQPSGLAPGRFGRHGGRRFVACRDGRVFFKQRLRLG